MSAVNWTTWKPMPSPQNCRTINAPAGLGVYQLRNKKTSELIIVGISVTCQKRMKSLFPEPYGVGKRNNSYKRQYVLDNWQDLEYRTLATNTREIAADFERTMLAENNHLFNT